MQMGDTALNLACTKGHVDIARVLIQKGASIDQIDEVRLHFVHQKTMLCVTTRIDLLMRVLNSIEPCSGSMT